MDVNKLAADAGRLSIPQLQQAMRDGTLPPYIGVPVLQEKVKLQKQMQAAQAAGQPKAPTVAEQVDSAAHQANMEDMMKARAAAMQDEMGQTGGISDFLPKPAEEAYAKGGPIAFRDEGYVNPDFLDAASDMDFDTWRRRQGIPGGQLPFSEDQLPQGFKDMASRIAAGKQAPRASFDFANPNQVATDVLANPARANTDPDLWQWASDYRAQNPIKTPSSVAAQAPAQSQGLATLYDEAIGQNPITTAEQARQQREAYLGPNTGIASLREDIGKMKSEAAEDKERAPWMALMKAGLATMAGTSPFALTNIGKGAQEGVADYMAAQKDYRHAQEKQLELNAKLDAAERQEKMDAYKFGEDSEKASRSANTALKIGKATAENKAELDRAELDLKKESNSIMRQHYADLNDKYDTAASGAASGLRGDINNKNALKALDQSLDTKLKDLREQYKTGTLIGQDIRQDERYIDIMNKKNAVQQKLAALAGIGKEIQTAPPPAKDYSLADKLSGYGR